MADIKLYVADMSSSREIKAKQHQAELILSGKKIPFEKIDISEDKELRTRMRELCDNPTALPPQLFYRDYYLGDFEALTDANEDGALMTFLRLSDPPAEATRTTDNGNPPAPSAPDEVDNNTASDSPPAADPSEETAEVEETQPPPAEPVPVACLQQISIHDDVTNNVTDDVTTTSHPQHNDVTPETANGEEQKTFVSTTTFTLSSS